MQGKLACATWNAEVHHNTEQIQNTGKPEETKKACAPKQYAPNDMTKHNLMIEPFITAIQSTSTHHTTPQIKPKLDIPIPTNPQQLCTPRFNSLHRRTIPIPVNIHEGEAQFITKPSITTEKSQQNNKQRKYEESDRASVRYCRR